MSIFVRSHARGTTNVKNYVRKASTVQKLVTRYRKAVDTRNKRVMKRIEGAIKGAGMHKRVLYKNSPFDLNRGMIDLSYRGR